MMHRHPKRLYGRQKKLQKIYKLLRPLLFLVNCYFKLPKSNEIIYDKLNIKTYLCKPIQMKVSLKVVRIVLFIDITKKYTY